MAFFCWECWGLYHSFDLAYVFVDIGKGHKDSPFIELFSIAPFVCDIEVLSGFWLIKYGQAESDLIRLTFRKINLAAV